MRTSEKRWLRRPSRSRALDVLLLHADPRCAGEISKCRGVGESRVQERRSGIVLNDPSSWRSRPSHGLLEARGRGELWHPFGMRRQVRVGFKPFQGVAAGSRGGRRAKRGANSSVIASEARRMGVALTRRTMGPACHHQMATRPPALTVPHKGGGNPAGRNSRSGFQRFQRVAPDSPGGRRPNRAAQQKLHVADVGIGGAGSSRRRCRRSSR